MLKIKRDKISEIDYLNFVYRRPSEYVAFGYFSNVNNSHSLEVVDPVSERERDSKRQAFVGNLQCLCRPTLQNVLLGSVIDRVKASCLW